MPSTTIAIKISLENLCQRLQLAQERDITKKKLLKKEDSQKQNSAFNPYLTSAQNLTIDWSIVPKMSI